MELLFFGLSRKLGAGLGLLQHLKSRILESTSFEDLGVFLYSELQISQHSQAVGK